MSTLDRLDGYKGSVEIHAGLKQKNDNKFALLGAHDVQVAEDGTRLDTKLADIATALGSYIEDVDALIGGDS